MKCPNCSIEMNQSSLKTDADAYALVDQCPQCGGVWFDRNELYRFAAVPDSLLAVDRKLLSAPVPQKEHLSCPKCSTMLAKYNDPVFKNMVVFMLCRDCGGIWMNSREMTDYAAFRAHFDKDEAKRKMIELYSNPDFAQNVRQAPGGFDLTSLPDAIIKTALVLIQLMVGFI